MAKTDQPGSVRAAIRLAWGLFGAGLLLVVAGVIELNHLHDNLPIVEQKSTFLAEAMRAAVHIEDSASLALQLGCFDLAVALLCWRLIAGGWRAGRAIVLICMGVVALFHVLLILQDGTIGVQPYVDLSGDLAQEELINSLLVAPGYFILLYPAESAGPILAVLIGWRMFQDSTVEYFQRRRRVTTDRVWDLEEILAKRQNGDS